MKYNCSEPIFTKLSLAWEFRYPNAIPISWKFEKKKRLFSRWYKQMDGWMGGLTCSPPNDFFLTLRKERLQGRRTFEILRQKCTVFCALSQWMELQSPLATVCATIHPLRIDRSSDSPITYIYMEMNVERTKVMTISRQPSTVTIMINQKQLENVACFKYLGSILTNYGRCTCDIKSRIAMAKPAFNKKKTLFTSTLDLNLRRKLVKCYIWSLALYGAQTWTLRAADQKYLESSEMCCWRRMEKTVGPIMWEMKKCYLESMSRGISYMK